MIGCFNLSDGIVSSLAALCLVLVPVPGTMFTPIETSFFRQLLKCLSSIGVQILKEEIELFNSGVSGPWIG
jgi:hypothetical protein